MIYDGLLPDDGPTDNLVEIAIATDILSTLVTAVVAADLVDTLASDGPFTVFAPTNDAFAALGDELISSLLSDEGIPTLTNILLYHVIVGAAVAAGDIVSGSSVDTAFGDSLGLTVKRGTVFVQDTGTDVPATVVLADVFATNGVAHVIDSE